MSKRATIDRTTVVRQAPDLVAAEMSGRQVMFSVARGRYFGLDDVASRIWSLIAVPRPVKGICSVLLSEFEGDEGRLEREVVRFLQEMADQGLVEVVDESPE